MKFLNKHLIGSKSLLISFAVVATIAVGSSVTLPFSFTAGTQAKAAEVNANFSAVKAAVDDNSAKITMLQSLPPYSTPVFTAGAWSNVGGAFTQVGFLKDPMGFVHIRGILRKNNVGGSNDIFTLPIGYRPGAILQFPSRCGDDTLCFIHIDSNGIVSFGAAAISDPTTSVSLDGIVFDPRP